MRCSKAQKLISAAMDGELSTQEGLFLARHLEECSGCRLYQEDLHACRVLLQESEMAPSANFEWKVQLGIRKALREGVAKNDSAPGRFWLPAGLSAVLSGVAVVLVGIWLLPQVEPRPQTVSGVAPVAWNAPRARSGSVLPVSSGVDASQTRVSLGRPVWRRGALPDWRTPPSLRGQVSTVNDLRMGVPTTIDPQLRLGSQRYRLVPRQAEAPADSTPHRESSLRH